IPQAVHSRISHMKDKAAVAFQDQRRKRGEITFAIDAVLAAAPQTAVEGLDDPHRRLLRAPGIRCCVVIGKKTRDGSLTRFPCCLARSEEHTSELQSRENLVCRLLLEKKK